MGLPHVVASLAELKDSLSDDRPRMRAATAILESDIAQAVQAAILGITTGAAVVTDVAGTIQQYLRGLVSLTVSHFGAVGAAADVDGNVHGQLRYIGEAAEANTCNVGNAPASPGDCVAVAAGGAGVSVQITQADLVPGTKYRLRVTPDIPTNVVMGLWKCSAAVAIADATDGTPILSHEEVIVRLPLGSTKVRLYFWMLAATDVACHVWLSQADA